MDAHQGRRSFLAGTATVGYGFLDIAATPSVKAAQAANGSAELWTDFRGDRDFDRFTEAEAAFITARDSFYMATLSETGWPYVQHRGGPPGFLRVLDAHTLGFADFAATGNTSAWETSRPTPGYR